MLLHAMEYLNSDNGEVSDLYPPPLINKLWVSHILETRSYASMCEQLVPGGCTIHYSHQK